MPRFMAYARIFYGDRAPRPAQNLGLQWWEIVHDDPSKAKTRRRKRPFLTEFGSTSKF